MLRRTIQVAPSVARGCCVTTFGRSLWASTWRREQWDLATPSPFAMHPLPSQEFETCTYGGFPGFPPTSLLLVTSPRRRWMIVVTCRAGEPLNLYCGLLRAWGGTCAYVGYFVIFAGKANEVFSFHGDLMSYPWMPCEPEISSCRTKTPKLPAGQVLSISSSRMLLRFTYHTSVPPRMHTFCSLRLRCVFFYQQSSTRRVYRYVVS